MNKRITLKITKIVRETKDINTYIFHYSLHAEPGQFIMLTDFEGGEKPFSIANCSENEFSITVKKIGKFTSRLFNKEEGDFLSIRGAYGSPFGIFPGKVLLVGGGYGVPPLYFLAKKLLQNDINITIANGAKTKNELIYSNQFENLGIEVFNSTDDGSFAKKCTVVETAENLIRTRKFDFVYASGPEMMMKNLQKVLKSIPYEFLFERYMKCAIGICGNCTMDPLGIRLCVEGPVLPKRLVEQLTEFGKYKRDASGKRIKF